MKVKVIKIKTKNPAAYLMNKYRAIVTEHINGALHIIAVNVPPEAKPFMRLSLFLFSFLRRRCPIIRIFPLSSFFKR